MMNPTAAAVVHFAAEVCRTLEDLGQPIAADIVGLTLEDYLNVHGTSVYDPALTESAVN